MSNVTYRVPNISCGKCVETIQRVVGDLDGVDSVSGDPQSKRVEVTFRAPATDDEIRRTMTEWDFPPQ